MNPPVKVEREGERKRTGSKKEKWLRRVARRSTTLVFLAPQLAVYREAPLIDTPFSHSEEALRQVPMLLPFPP